MASEKYSNNATTTLSASINNVTTSVAVTDASLFPSSGQFRIKVENEIMLVTGVAANTFTVTRGVESTAAAAHAIASTVKQVLTKGALDQVIIDNCQSVAYASIPAAEKSGRQIFVSDGLHVLRDNGTTLDAFFQGGPQVKIPPLSSAFTWYNQSVSTIVDNKGTLFLQNACNASNSVSGMYKTAPATPYTLTVHFNSDIAVQNYSGYGLFWRESSSGKIVTVQFATISVLVYACRKWTNSTTFSADYSQLPALALPWIRLSDDGSTRKAFVSADGINWKQMDSHGRTDFMTANQIGFCILPEKGVGLTTLTQGFSIDSWLEA